MYCLLNYALISWSCFMIYDSSTRLATTNSKRITMEFQNANFSLWSAYSVKRRVGTGQHLEQWRSSQKTEDHAQYPSFTHLIGQMFKTVICSKFYDATRCYVTRPCDAVGLHEDRGYTVIRIWAGLPSLFKSKARAFMSCRVCSVFFFVIRVVNPG